MWCSSWAQGGLKQIAGALGMLSSLALEGLTAVRVCFKPAVFLAYRKPQKVSLGVQQQSIVSLVSMGSPLSFCFLWGCMLEYFSLSNAFVVVFLAPLNVSQQNPIQS